MRTKTAIAGGLLAVMLSGASLAADWPNWRGPDHNGVSTEKGWLTAWPKAGPKRLWTTEVGPGHAGVAVRAGKVYIMGRHGDRDVVSCFNADTGATVWKHSYAAAESSYGRGPRATPAVDGKAVYTVSADGQVFCLDVVSGRVIWRKNLPKELDLPMPVQNFATAPILEGEVLLLNMGASGLALDKKTGRVIWKSAGDSSYSSPVPFNLAGKRCVALFAASKLAVVDLAGGRIIASYEWKTLQNANCADPVIVGDAIFVSSGYGVGCALIGVSGDRAAPLWKRGFECHYATPVLVGDCLYLLAGSGWMKADLVCVNARDGSLGMAKEGCGKRRPRGGGREADHPLAPRRVDSGAGVAGRLFRDRPRAGLRKGRLLEWSRTQRRPHLRPQRKRNLGLPGRAAKLTAAEICNRERQDEPEDR